MPLAQTARKASMFTAFLIPCAVFAQDNMPGHNMPGHDTPAHGMPASVQKKAAMPSRDLALTGIGGTAKVITAADLKAMPHVTVTVTNEHTHTQETYSGVPVLAVLKLIPPMAGAAEPKPLTTVIVPQGTDGYRVVISICDVDPACRNGQAIVADQIDGQPLTTDGAFKLILSEDKMPKRWVRNLSALTEKSIEP